jgi:hypothetical protein
MTIELFHVTTTITKYRGCENVAMNWFYCDRKTPLGPYAQLIANYDPADEYRMYAKGAIDEMFTADEAQALVTYLRKGMGRHPGRRPTRLLHIVQGRRMGSAVSGLGLLRSSPT